MTAYPPTLPPDLDDLAVIADHDWAAFQDLDRVESHWRRPGWTDGRSSYHWMITFDGCGPVAEHAARCRPAVPPAGYDLVDPAALHLTIGRVGFTDELSLPQAHAVAAATSRPAVPPGFMLSFGPLTGSRGAIRLSVGPWNPLLAVHAFLSSATQSVLGECGTMDTSTFRPHLSIAYAHTPADAAAVADRLRGWRNVPGPTVPIAAVDLVRLQRMGRTYRYNTVKRVDLLPPE